MSGTGQKFWLKNFLNFYPIWPRHLPEGKSIPWHSGCDSLSTTVGSWLKTLIARGISAQANPPCLTRSALIAPTRYAISLKLISHTLIALELAHSLLRHRNNSYCFLGGETLNCPLYQASLLNCCWNSYQHWSRMPVSGPNALSQGSLDSLWICSPSIHTVAAY